MSLPNIWHLRRVADTAARACYICYKPSSSVLITPDNKVRRLTASGITLNTKLHSAASKSIYSSIINQSKDFFYICPAHLQDRHFCSPVVDSAEEARKKRDEAMAREIEAVKREYEEKQSRKKGKEKEKEKEKEKGEDGESKEKKEEKKEEKERDDKVRLVFFAYTLHNIHL